MVLASGATTLPVTAGAAVFTLSAAVPSGTSYNITVSTQPTGLTCTVSNGTGTVTATVSNIAIACVKNNYTVGGTISNLTGTGLVLATGGSTASPAAAAATFTLAPAIAYNSSYNVLVQTQPSGQACFVNNGSGTVGAANVTNVAVTCGFTVGGTINGLNTAGLVLAVNGTTTLTVAANGTSFTMPAAFATGASYVVTVQTQPAGNQCSLQSGASGTVASSNVTNVIVNCVNKTFTLGGTISGLTASGLVLVNAGSGTTVTSGASTFTMTTPVAFGSTYNLTVQTQPAGRACVVASGSGTMPANNVTSVVVTCVAALQGRSFDGGATVSAYYDAAQNITWLKNNNAGAGTSYDDGKFNNDGRMTWLHALDFVSNLTLGGVTGWRMPTMIDTGNPGCSGEFSLTGNTSCGQNVFTTPQVTVSPGVVTNSSEMAYLDYVILGNKSAFNTSGGQNPQPWLATSAPFPTIPQGYNVVNYAPFTTCTNPPNTDDPRNCRDDAFWSYLTDASNSGSAWKFSFGAGEQLGDSKNVEYFVWAVHDGDVGTPVP